MPNCMKNVTSENVMSVNRKAVKAGSAPQGGSPPTARDVILAGGGSH